MTSLLESIVAIIIALRKTNSSGIVLYQHG
jgi:hypothetical protein